MDACVYRTSTVILSKRSKAERVERSAISDGEDGFLCRADVVIGPYA